MSTKKFQLVKILAYEDGEKIDKPHWHLVVTKYRDGPRALCSGVVFGEGESRVEYKTKDAYRLGKICPKCLEIINWFKSIPL